MPLEGSAALSGQKLINSASFQDVLQSVFNQTYTTCGDTGSPFYLPIPNTITIQVRFKQAVPGSALVPKFLVNGSSASFTTSTAPDGATVFTAAISQPKGSKTAKFQLAKKNAADPDVLLDSAAGDEVSMTVQTNCG